MVHARPRRVWPWVVVGVLVVVGLAGCLKVPLGDPEQSKVDPRLAGVWMKRDDASGEINLLIAKSWDGRTYHVAQLSAKPDPAGAWERGGQLLYKAWLTEIAGRQFVTMQVLNSETDTPYLVARLDLLGDSFEARGIKPDFVTANNIETNTEFAALVEANVDNIEMYFDDIQKYFKADGPDMEMVREIQRQFGWSE